MRLSAVILAGGRSLRMGSDKAWVRYRGRPLIRVAIETLGRLGIDEIFVSGRGDQDFRTLKRPVLVDAVDGLGPISGIERALREASSSLVLVLPVDLPALTAACLQKLVRGCDRLTGAVAQVRGRLEPLTAVYPKRCHAYAALNIARGAYAVHEFATACRRERAVRVFRVPALDSAGWTNCNTPMDLAGLSLRGA